MGADEVLEGLEKQFYANVTDSVLQAARIPAPSPIPGSAPEFPSMSFSNIAALATPEGRMRISQGLYSIVASGGKLTEGETGFTVLGGTSLGALILAGNTTASAEVISKIPGMDKPKAILAANYLNHVVQSFFKNFAKNTEIESHRKAIITSFKNAGIDLETAGRTYDREVMQAESERFQEAKDAAVQYSMGKRSQKQTRLMTGDIVAWLGSFPGQGGSPVPLGDSAALFVLLGAGGTGAEKEFKALGFGTRWDKDKKKWVPHLGGLQADRDRFVQELTKIIGPDALAHLISEGKRNLNDSLIDARSDAVGAFLDNPLFPAANFDPSKPSKPLLKVIQEKGYERLSSIYKFIRDNDALIVIGGVAVGVAKRSAIDEYITKNPAKFALGGLAAGGVGTALLGTGIFCGKVEELDKYFNYKPNNAAPKSGRRTPATPSTVLPSPQIIGQVLPPKNLADLAQQFVADEYHYADHKQLAEDFRKLTHTTDEYPFLQVDLRSENFDLVGIPAAEFTNYMTQKISPEQWEMIDAEARRHLAEPNDKVIA